jgi:hypothetical protein
MSDGICRINEPEQEAVTLLTGSTRQAVGGPIMSPQSSHPHTIRKDLTGKVFGRLTVLYRTDRKTSQGFRLYWMCRCECGNETEVYRCKLTGGRTVSCGCRLKEIRAWFPTQSLKHGMSKGCKEFRSWASMRGRCCNQQNHKFPIYGGRGIKICDRWMESFQNFYDDMGQAPSKLHSIDRIDVNGDYCPENCRWAVAAQQSDNKTNTVRLTWNGVTRTVTEWSRIVGVQRMTIKARLKYGWSVDSALSTPVDTTKRKRGKNHGPVV